MEKKISPIREQKITVANGTLFIEAFTDQDPTTVNYVAKADNPDAAIRQLLRTGAVAINAAGNELTTQNLELAFTTLSEQFDTALNTAVNDISSAADHVISSAETLTNTETGALPATLKEHSQQLSSLLGDTFDPESKRSVIAAFETVMADAFQKHTDTIRQLVSLDGDDSPLNKHKRELAHTFNEGLALLRNDFSELSETIAVEKASNAARQKSNAKGFDFEATIDQIVGSIAAQHGDFFEPTGTTVGNDATKKGDEVVELNREDTNGKKASFVWEAKATKTTMRNTHDELDKALTNRNAQAAIAVFSDQTTAPISIPFNYCDNKAIVVYDENDPNNASILLAYMWARWVTRRTITTTTEHVNTERIESLLHKAQLELERVTTIRKAHNSARKSINQAADHLDELSRGIHTVLTTIETEIQQSPTNQTKGTT